MAAGREATLPALCYWISATTRFSSTPTCSISQRTRSPGFRNPGLGHDAEVGPRRAKGVRVRVPGARLRAVAVHLFELAERHDAGVPPL